MASELVWAVFGIGVVAGLANSIGVLASAFGGSEYYPVGGRDWNYYAF